MHAALLVGFSALAAAQLPSSPAGLHRQASELFVDTRDALWAEARLAFLQDAALPDAAGLTGIARTLPDDRSVQDASQEFSAVVWQARYVQQGPRPGDDYRSLVDYAAARLGAPQAQAEAVYLSSRRPSTRGRSDDPVLALQLRREAEVFRKKLDSGAALAKAQALARQLGDQPGPQGPVYVTRIEPTVAAGGRRVPVEGRSRPAATRFPAPPPDLGPPPVGELVAQNRLPEAFLKYSPRRGNALADASKTFGLSPYEECLYAVKRAFERAGYDVGGLLGFHRAYEFALHMSPEALDKLHLLKLGPPETGRLSTLPRGAVIVYPPGVCRTDARAGHIELVTQQGIPELGVPTVAESDAPHRVNFNCVRRASVYIPVD